MKKKFLSILICTTLIVSQNVMIPIQVKAVENNTIANENVVSKFDRVVDCSFKGNNGDLVNGVQTYKTVKDAINSIEDNNSSEKVIYVKNGTYKEKLKIAKPNVTLVGESSSKTILTFDDAAGTIKRTEDGGDGTKTYGTSSSSSVTITSAAVNFAAKNITFENSFDEIANSTMKNQQAVALKNEADKSVFVNCRFLGNQDTLYANKNNQYYYKCYIEGDVDFIFGGASAVFEECEIKSLNRENAEASGYVTAPSTEKGNYGFLIENSKLTSDITKPGTIYLGRPWHPSSSVKAGIELNSFVVYKNCEMGSHISKEGWTSMTTTNANNEKIVVKPEENTMVEYGSTGAGALTSATRKPISGEEAKKYTKETVLSSWNAQAVADKLDSIGGQASNDTSTDDKKEDVVWKQTRFGVKTSAEDNHISVDDVNKTVTLTAGTADGSTTGGKVTGSNDGISYYYTEVDPSENFEISANVKVNFFEKIKKPDNQCAFGIMARDTLGANNDDSVAPSNMALVGGYKANIASVFRNGVTPDLSSKIVMENNHKFAGRPANDGTSTYKLTLKKTNTGYVASVNDGEEFTYYRPDQLEVVEKDKIYVGFFVARVASITVSDISFKTSDSKTDAPKQNEPVKKVEPEMKVTSAKNTGLKKYDLKLDSTVSGKVSVKQAGKEIYNGEVKDSKELSVGTELELGKNTFDITYTPEGKEPITLNHSVTYKTYGVEEGDVYVSQEGTENGKGTLESPIDIYTAAKFTGEGQSIKVKGGKYDLKDTIKIDATNSGTAEKMKTLTTYDGERAIFDLGQNAAGFDLAGDYWHVYGIDVTNSQDAKYGMKVLGNHNIVENVKTYNNGDTGLQISGDQSKELADWPSYNTILNCDSYDNMDAAMNNADGFAAKISVGVGNVFKGCISHNNCDDGWDLFSKLEIGQIGAVTIEDCIAYGNGTLTNGTKTDGDGNGFKLGGEGIPVKHTLKNSLSFNNDADGITGNSNPSACVENSISVDNKDSNVSLDYYTNAELKYELNKVISFRTKEGNKDNIPDKVRGESNYFNDGVTSSNTKGEKIEASMFKSTEMPKSYERDNDGNIIWGDYMALVQKEEPSKEPAKDPAKEPSKEPAKDPAKEPSKDPVKEPVKDPVKDPVKEPSKEPVKDPAKEPSKDLAKNPVIEEPAGGAAANGAGDTAANGTADNNAQGTNNGTNSTKTGDAGVLGILGLGAMSLAGLFGAKRKRRK